MRALVFHGGSRGFSVYWGIIFYGLSSTTRAKWARGITAARMLMTTNQRTSIDAAAATMIVAAPRNNFF